MEIEVIRPGLFTSIQDGGRPGLASYGIPVGGYMDSYAALLANSLVQNLRDAAVMEITFQGPKLRFDGEAEAAFSGIKGDALLNAKKVSINRPFSVRKDDLLDIKRVTRGCRLYLAIKGGFLTEKILGSRSMMAGITPKGKLKKGDRLTFEDAYESRAPTHSALRFDADRYQTHWITASPGPEWDRLPPAQKDVLFSREFRVSAQSNRMAYLIKENFKNRIAPILTGPVLPGTVQLTPAGRLIILMKDCQVTGGYPRILKVSRDALSILAQKRPGAVVQFKLQ